MDILKSLILTAALIAFGLAIYFTAGLLVPIIIFILIFLLIHTLMTEDEE